MSDARTIMKHFMKDLLNKSLKNQGMEDVEVVDISDNYQVAKVAVWKPTLRVVAVQSQILLPRLAPRRRKTFYTVVS